MPNNSPAKISVEDECEKGIDLYSLPVAFQMFPYVRLAPTFSDFGLRSSFYIHI